MQCPYKNVSHTCETQLNSGAGAKATLISWSRNDLRRLMMVSLLIISTTLTALGQDSYQTPPADLAKLVDAPATPSVSISPDEQTLLIMARPGLPSIAEVAAPELRLAGVRINPNNHGPSRATAYTGLTLTSLDGSSREVQGVPNSGIRNVSWSPLSTHIAFTVDIEDEIFLYIADVQSGAARRLSNTAISNTLGQPLTWLPNGESVLVRTVPSNIGAVPQKRAAPAGPMIQDNEGTVAPARTYQDLLAGPHDQELFKHYFTSELVKLNLTGGRSVVGTPAIYRSAEPSPDGRYILVETILEPFSYLVPYSRFPRSVFVVDADGQNAQQIAALPLAEDVPTGFGSVPTGPRSISWRSDVPSTLYWVEAADGGDANVEAAVRDKMVVLEQPFTERPVVFAELPLRFGGVQWVDEKRALVSERWSSTRQTRTYIYDPSTPGQPVSTLFDRSSEDRYGDPGRPMTHTNSYGQDVVRTSKDGKSIYLTGTGASPEGNRPFLRMMNLKSGKTTDLFRSGAPYYETPVAMLKNGDLITRRESNDEPPNYFVRRGKKQPQALTNFPHPYPEMLGLQRETIQYKRADGLDLSAVLYLPKGYDSERDGPLPGLVWAYPREFKDASAASQRTDSPYQFTRVSYWGAIPYVTQGFAIIDNASMPIIGEGDLQPNDVFRQQLVSNAQAAIDEGVRRGVLDPDRVAVGGHSYGAFMTANLLAHSDLFKAGIARSGAYNRTLTPFGFQSEERTYWEAPEIYYGMSPFMHADKVNEPLLMIHGEADNNSGTFPIQSKRYYAALKGLGKTARLVMLPAESHGYRARESIMHMLWETNRWLDMHVKNPSTIDVKESTG